MQTIRRSSLLLLLLVLLAVAAYFIYLRSAARTLPEGLIQANGRIEGDHVIISPKFASRIADLRVREGDAVAPGQLLVMMDDSQAKAKLKQAASAADAARAQMESAKSAYAVLKSEVPNAIGSADAALSRARHGALKARATAQQAAREAERAQMLVARKFVDPQRAEQAELALTAANADERSAQDAIKQAERQLADARLGWDRLKAKADEITALQAQLAQANAALEEARSVLDDLAIKAPSAGVVLTRFRDKGEVLGAGSPIFDIVDLDKLYLNVYVPETAIGKLRLNLPARIYTDAFPDTPFPATVKMISSRAEFTPKEVQTQDERTKLTYAVRLYLDRNPDHRLTPGLPADAVIRWKEGVEWMKPRW
ncbi:MAG TPA: efflux RND transporter periplasmic adaptor subunit [Burkholderiaceae bacterium]|jgi:HlyD family secretion protein|nr:efflux RND transporter periplasmic adaptor subunit [Burkholderiaceae bacterium]